MLRDVNIESCNVLSTPQEVRDEIPSNDEITT